MRNLMISCVPVVRERMLGKLIMTAIVALAIGFPSDMLRAESRWTPFLNLSATKDDNINFVRKNPIEDYVYLINPGIQYEYDQELTKFTSIGHVEVRKYQDNEDLDDESYKFKLNGLKNITERFAVNGQYDFIKDTTLDTELEETGRVTEREDRYSHYASLSPDFKLNELVSIGISGNYRNVTYDANNDVDYIRWEVGIPIRWRLATQVDSLYIRPSFSETDSDVNRSTSYNFRVGWSHETTERLNVNLSVGARYTEHEDKGSSATEENWNGLGKLKLTYVFERGDFTVDLQHDLQNSANGDQVNVSRAIVRLKYYFTERMGIGFDGRYYYTETEGEDNDDTTNYFRVGPDIFYNLTENHVIFVAYEYSQEEVDNLPVDPVTLRKPDSTAERNKVWAGIRLNFPI